MCWFAREKAAQAAEARREGCGGGREAAGGSPPLWSCCCRFCSSPASLPPTPALGRGTERVAGGRGGGASSLMCSALSRGPPRRGAVFFSAVGLGGARWPGSRGQTSAGGASVVVRGFNFPPGPSPRVPKTGLPGRLRLAAPRSPLPIRCCPGVREPCVGKGLRGTPGVVVGRASSPSALPQFLPLQGLGDGRSRPTGVVGPGWRRPVPRPELLWPSFSPFLGLKPGTRASAGRICFRGGGRPRWSAPPACGPERDGGKCPRAREMARARRRRLALPRLAWPVRTEPPP